MRGADLLIKSLSKAGVTRIFSLSGNQIMPVYDACIDAGIEIVHTRHEAAAVYMAEAYAQLTGQVGVAMVTAGAGAANALGPLLTASASETPILLLTGDSPINQDGRGAFQEMQQVAMIEPLTKHSVRPKKGADLGREVARAFRIAQTGRPGPVHISLAFDVVEEDASAGEIPAKIAFQRDHIIPKNKDVEAIIQSISDAKFPVIICGPVLNGTRYNELAVLADALGAPVIPMESPRGLKDPSLGGISQVLAKADLIVNLGKRVDFTLSFGKKEVFAENVKWINIQSSVEELDRADLNLGTRLKMRVLADPRDAAKELISGAKKTNVHDNWRMEVEKLLKSRSFSKTTEGKISSYDLCAAVQRQILKAKEPITVCDGGEFGQWAQAVTSSAVRVINGISGAIGGGICYGLAARLARPNSTVFALMGDGTVGFHLAEFETAAREGIPYVVIIGNDFRWNAEHQIQLREYGPDRLIGCQLSPARYDLAAEALGGHGEFVTRVEDLDDALARAVESGKPACVNVIIEGMPAPSGSAH